MRLSNFFEKIDNAYGYLGFTVLAIAITFLRKPETLLHAQLWAEDGKIWLAQAYNIGHWKSLLITDGGYFQTFSRIIAGLSLLLPLIKAPIFFNTAEFLLQISVPLFLLTNRFKSLIPRLEVRLLLALLYLLLPNTAELDGHLTSSQWYLAVLAFLVLIASPGFKNRLWQFFDALVLLMSGLTGTFAIFLAPIAGVLWYKRRQAQSLTNFLLITAAGIIQALSVFVFSHENRVHSSVAGLTFREGYAIFSRQVIWGVLSGAKGYTWLLAHFSFALTAILIVSILATAFIIYALIKAPLELKLFLCFGLVVFLATLFTPTKMNLAYPIIKYFSRSTDGIRYWFIPMLSFVVSLVWGLTSAQHKFVKIFAGSFLVCCLFGIIIDFRHLPYPDYNFAGQVEKFSQLSPGKHFIFAITPPGWQMDLVKK